MRWVESAPVRPQRCAALPYIGNSNSQYGFIDTGAELPGFDNHVYVSVVAVREMAKLIGWDDPSLWKPGLERSQARVAELEQQVAELQEQLAAVQVLKSAGYTAARKPGRPPKAKAVA